MKPSRFHPGHYFPINECIGREPFTGTGNMRKLLCEEVFSTRSKSDTG
jgi:hypothetical protein